jgi:hypothetical protein
MKATTVQRQALDDRLLTALRVEGPLTTGQLARLCGPYFETRRQNHGAWTHCDGELKWLECCSHEETVEVDSRYMAPTVRTAMKRLERQGVVVELQAPIPNNHGGNVWMRIDQENP